MQSQGALGWIEQSALAEAMRTGLWTYPIVEIVHIVGFVLLVGSVAMFDLRLLGLGKALSVQALGRHLLRWTLLSLVLVVPAGLLMFSAHPSDFLGNPVFLLKLVLILLAGLNALLFHARVYRGAAEWDVGAEPPAAAKSHALVSLFTWIAVISCGRLLAYT
ncbi:DUF6644 family protein [Noviherbaspirillum aridicola]|uniref:DUF6644 domain-containing protein n=1 Tax=Noviherbaspirillum aridicola TaxID=2849687 RepID=A0ABQ4PZE6_9BURK|nr:DUF6644 family protein [Noviherbaspirillum aridicola]GIZ50229.1 hypothetical protein NCCP691_02430 [Noviherbaspirillum aridicola]